MFCKASSVTEKNIGQRIWEMAGSLTLARRHRVSALLHILKPKGASDEERKGFAQDFRKTLAENLMYLSETKEILQTLESGGIEVLPLKGVLFAARFYPSIGARPQSDVDILVREKRLNRAHEILIRRGWREAWPREFYKGHYHWVYRRNEILLELHWAFKFPGTCSPDLNRIWKRARWVEAEGLRFLEMAPEDTLSYFCLNKAMQHFPHLIDFVDIALIIQKSQIDWGLLTGSARQDKTEGPLWFGLRHAKDILGAKVPEEVLLTLSRSFRASGAVFLKNLLRCFGGPAKIPTKFLEGPYGRIYEALLEGRPSAAFSLMKPLIFPSRARRELLTNGSYGRYLWKTFRSLIHPSFHHP